MEISVFIRKDLQQNINGFLNKSDSIPRFVELYSNTLNGVWIVKIADRAFVTWVHKTQRL